MLARNVLAPTWLSLTPPEGCAKPGYVQQLSRIIGFTEVSLMRAVLSVASSGRLLAGLAPVCFAPNLLSGFIAFDGVRPPPSTQVNCASSALGFPRFLKAIQSPKWSSSRISTRIRGVSKGAVESASPALSPSFLGFILRVSCQLPGTILCSFKEP